MASKSAKTPKIALVSGIFGNLPALNAFLESAKKQRIPNSRVFCLGNIVGPCGSPIEVLEKARKFKGNIKGPFEKALEFADIGAFSQKSLRELINLNSNWAKSAQLAAETQQQRPDYIDAITFIYDLPKIVQIRKGITGLNGTARIEDCNLGRVAQFMRDQKLRVTFLGTAVPGARVYNKKGNASEPDKEFTLRKDEVAVVGTGSIGLSLTQDKNYLKELDRRRYQGVPFSKDKYLFGQYVILQGSKERPKITPVRICYSSKPSTDSAEALGLKDPFTELNKKIGRKK